ncbi:MAG TPA: ArdC family protein [Vicinamibacterales bacterium]|nr:ArdC family protein [Vicinamibacterales bacterium]
MATVSPATFVDLLHQAVTEPGIISRAYSAFHGYSLGNQILALVQCAQRGIAPGPMATFMGWKDKGRYVRKGEKAITLCMPVTCKRTIDTDEGDDTATFTRFVYRPNWFVVSQTDGQAVDPVSTPAWDRSRALATLEITEEPFTMLDGNCQGYARQRSIAVSPVAAMPVKTTFHEIAHVLLGHTSEGDQSDGDTTPRNLCECEAEAVAMLCCAALELPGVECCRGYIQAWWGVGHEIPERSAQRIFKAADQILRAGAADVSASALS